MARTYGKAQDLIDFTRASSGTALRRVKYGAELVTNGDFSNGTTGWTNIDGAWSVISNTLQRSAIYDNTGVSQTVNSAGVHLLTLDISACSGISGTAMFQVLVDGAPVYSKIDNTEETLSIVYVANTSHTVTLGTYAYSTNVSYVIDNVSVKEVTFDTSDGDLILFNHPNNIPRIEYDANGNLLGLLVEESRTNLVTYSDLSSGWTELNSSLSSSSVTAPDGVDTMVTVTATTGTAGHEAYFTYSSSSGTYTMTCYAKLGTSDYLFLSITDTATGQAEKRFNLADGTVDSTNILGAGSWTNISGSITHVGNNIYRCSLTGTQGAGTVIRARVAVGSKTGERTYTPTDDAIYAWGAQLEVGSFPTSYIPTSGSTATRSADVASLSTSAFGYRQDEGSVVVEALVGQDTFASMASLQTGLASVIDRISLLRTAPTALEITISTPSGAQLQQFEGFGGDNTENKIGVSFKENSGISSFNGNIEVEDTTLSVPTTISVLMLGRYASSNYLNGHIKSLKYYPRRLTNAQLQELTS